MVSAAYEPIIQDNALLSQVPTCLVWLYSVANSPQVTLVWKKPALGAAGGAIRGNVQHVRGYCPVDRVLEGVNHRRTSV